MNFQNARRGHVVHVFAWLGLLDLLDRQISAAESCPNRDSYALLNNHRARFVSNLNLNHGGTHFSFWSHHALPSTQHTYMPIQYRYMCPSKCVTSVPRKSHHNLSISGRIPNRCNPTPVPLSHEQYPIPTLGRYFNTCLLAP